MTAIRLVLASLLLAQTNPSDTTTPPESPALKLEHLGTIQLEANRYAGDRWLVLNFDIDEKGRIGFIESGKQNRTRFLLLKADGSQAAEFPLDIRDTVDVIDAQLRWIDGENWLILGRKHMRDVTNAHAWHLDVAKGQVSKLDPFDCPSTKAVSRDRDGGFLVYSGFSPVASISRGLIVGGEIIAFDLKGKRKWRTDIPVGGGSSSFDHRSFPPYLGDMTTTTDGEISLLDTNTEDVHVFSEKGEYRRTICSGQLGSCMSTDNACITPDLNGDVFVGDKYSSGFRRVCLRPPAATAGSQQLLTYGSDEALLEIMKGPRVPPNQIIARYSDGIALYTCRCPRMAPNGRLWTTDSRRLLRLTNEGTVDQVIGEPLDDLLVPQEGRPFIDQKGRTYFMNNRTGTVHVFDSLGKKLHRCQCEPDDFKKSAGYCYSVSPDGGVFVWQKDSECLSFSPKGDRLGFVDLGPLVRRARAMLFQPDSMKAWLLADNRCHQIDANGNELLTLTKKSNGEDLQKTRDAAVAPDGSIAVLDIRYGQKDTDETMSLFAPDGKPLQVITVADRQHWAGQMAFDGRRVVSITSKDKSLIMYVMKTGAIQPLDLRLKDKEWRAAAPFFSMQGRELWLLYVNDLTIDRYRFTQN